MTEKWNSYVDFCGGEMRGGACEGSASIFPKISEETILATFLTWKERDQLNYCFRCLHNLASVQNDFLEKTLDTLNEEWMKDDRLFAALHSSDEISVLQLAENDSLLLLGDIDSSLETFAASQVTELTQQRSLIHWQRVQRHVPLSLSLTTAAPTLLEWKASPELFHPKRFRFSIEGKRKGQETLH